MFDSNLHIKGIDLIDLISRLKKDYSIPSTHKQYLISDNVEIHNLSKKIEFNTEDTLWISIGQKTIHNKYRLGVHVEKDFTIFTFLDNGLSVMCLLFVKDIDEFKKKFFSVMETQPLEKGLYKITSGIGGSGLVEVAPTESIEPILNDDLAKTITDEIAMFQRSEHIYKKNNMPYKRGILLYGPPGNGKTSLLTTIIKDVNAVSIIVDLNSHDEISFIEELLNNDSIKIPKIVIFEDLDGVGEYNRSEILNFFDGVTKINNTLFIATTNHLHKIDAGLINRPSRFDSIYSIDLPNEETRKKILKLYFKKVSKRELDVAAKETECFSGAFFKELFLISEYHSIGLVDAVNKLKDKFKKYKEFKEDTKVNYLG